MATFWHGATSETTPSFTDRIRENLHQVSGWIAERRARGLALRELQSMDERDLRDLRISPYDFKEIANGTFRR